ncbi:glutamate receptor 2.3-like [Silene latifolia]|uniref:glutamate receptor 2.3-like n=1 Tax=Silene latifolia TaxID=37657 RepID=UPI003D789C4C
MKREIIVQILISILGLISKSAWSQGNVTSTRSKLKIAIPVREFSDFVDINRNLVTGENDYSGFAIEVFKEVMNTSLTSPIPFEFVPFQKVDGTMKGSFDDMLQAVLAKEYDGAVGDISILYYRTRWVDFTMPFMDSSITMLVPINQPITKDVGYSLRGITSAFLITTFVLGFIVVVVGAISTCTRCFGRNDAMPGDKTLRSLLQIRLLITTFFLILLALISCYVISQTSSNTYQRRNNGTIENLTQLIRKGSNVGYREGSFIYNLLLLKGFSKSKLISLKSEGEMVEMLSKGTLKGGVDAIVANAPHLKLLQAKYCDNFTMVPTTNLHATGFGFAFAKGSDVLEDVSTGILKLVDGGRLGKIQDRTIGNLEACQDDRNNNVDAASSFVSPGYEWILIVGGLLIGLLIILSLIFLF